MAGGAHKLSSVYGSRLLCAFPGWCLCEWLCATQGPTTGRHREVGASTGTVVSGIGGWRREHCSGGEEELPAYTSIPGEGALQVLSTPLAWMWG